MWVNNLPKVATQWNSGATWDSNPGHWARIPSMLTTTVTSDYTTEPLVVKQEIWANAHETHDSISLISYAGYLGLHEVISAKIHSKCASQPKKSEKFTKNPYFGVQGRSRSSMLVPPESSSAVLVMIRSKSVSICNRSHARLVDSSRSRTFSRGYPNVMRSYGGLLEPRGRSLHR